MVTNLSAALRTDSGKQAEDLAADREETVCHCYGKTRAEIRADVLRLSLKTAEDVARSVLAGAGCSLCRPQVEEVLEELRTETTSAVQP